eukprot:scaffold133945_cov36-Cyclotella_meneghiniana.AAC.1
MEFCCFDKCHIGPHGDQIYWDKFVEFQGKTDASVVASIGNLKAMLSKKGPAIVLIYRRSSQNSVFIRPLITLYLHARCVNREMNGMM